MANFLRLEIDIKALRQNMIAGMKGNADFSNPPVKENEVKYLLHDLNAVEKAPSLGADRKTLNKTGESNPSNTVTARLGGGESWVWRKSCLTNAGTKIR